MNRFLIEGYFSAEEIFKIDDIIRKSITAGIVIMRIYRKNSKIIVDYRSDVMESKDEN